MYGDYISEVMEIFFILPLLLIKIGWLQKKKKKKLKTKMCSMVQYSNFCSDTGVMQYVSFSFSIELHLDGSLLMGFYIREWKT